MKRSWLVLAIVILVLTMLGSFMMITIIMEKVAIHKVYQDVLTMEEVAEYLRITEVDVQKIIDTETLQLEKKGSFYGMMFPYFEIGEKKLFYKKQIDLWLIDAVTDKRTY